MSFKYAQFKIEQIVYGSNLYNLLEDIKKGIKLLGNGTELQKSDLETVLHYEIPQMINPNHRIKPITKKQVNNTIETLTFLGYIKSSSETYKLTSKAKRMIQ